MDRHASRTKAASSVPLLWLPTHPFSAALERWSGEHGGNKLRFECGSEQEAESWSHLLDCIHSMGRQLPAGGWATSSSVILLCSLRCAAGLLACMPEGVTTCTLSSIRLTSLS